MRSITPEVLSKLKQWEGFVGYTYDDQDPSRPRRRIVAGDKITGRLTIGYGHTGMDVIPGETMTEAQAARQLMLDVAWAEKAVFENVKVELTDNQFGALVSFCYNVGSSAFKSSTLLKKLNTGDYASVPAQLARWTHDGGKVVQGLVNRRAAEAGLWATGDFVASSSVPTHAAVAPAISKETVTYAASLIGSLGSILSGTGPVQYAFAAVFVIAACVAGYLFVQSRRHT